jgi:hypothetical protein
MSGLDRGGWDSLPLYSSRGIFQLTLSGQRRCADNKSGLVSDKSGNLNSQSLQIHRWATVTLIDDMLPYKFSRHPSEVRLCAGLGPIA